MATDPVLAPEARFSTIVEALRGSPGVSPPSDDDPSSRRFGSTALKVDGKIFAMLVKGTVVVKLPRQRVDALIAAGAGERFDSGHGRAMKEWVTLSTTSGDDWLLLAREALAFVGRR